MSKVQAARLFDVSLSSVKRYARAAHQGDSLSPKKVSGRPSKADENVQKLLEGDVLLRPGATIADRSRLLEYLTAFV